jgi:hypothetical protein
MEQVYGELRVTTLGQRGNREVQIALESTVYLSISLSDLKQSL